MPRSQCCLESVSFFILSWNKPPHLTPPPKKSLNLVGSNKRKNVVKGRFLLCKQQRTCREWLKVPEGIWSLLVFTSNAMVPTDSLYCCQLNGIMSVWKVFENEPKIIFTSGWLLLPHVNRTLSEWPRFLSLH